MKPQPHTLFDPSMSPQQRPDEPYTPTAHTIAWKPAPDGLIVLEIYRRPGGAYGFRYLAWVAWRDAGGDVRRHTWWQTEPDGLLTDEYETACTVSEAHARECGVGLERVWRRVV
jgi:hypothetical protein